MIICLQCDAIGVEEVVQGLERILGGHPSLGLILGMFSRDFSGI